MIKIIAAIGKNNELGKNNSLPLWRLLTDFKRFKELTTSGTVVMGRKTFESLPEKFRPLPNRKNIVITRDSNFNSDQTFDIIVEPNLESAINHLQNEQEVFIIGGGEIYKQSLHLIDTIYKTSVNTTIEGDVYFSEIDPNQFELVWEEKHLADEKNKMDYTFQKYIKR